MKIFPTTAEELLSRVVKVLFYGLKAIGLAPLSIQFAKLGRNSRNSSVKVFLFSKMGLLHNLAFATFVLIMGILGIPSVIFTEYISILNLMRHIPHMFTSLFIVVYLAIRQQKAAIIMNRLLDVHFLLFGVREHSSSKRIHIFLSAQGAVLVILWATCLSISSAFGDGFLNIVGTFLIHIIIFIFCVEYSIILGVVVRELEILNQNLSNLKDFPNYLFRISLPNEHPAILSAPNQSQLATLKLLRSVRTTLFELSHDVADFFSFPILLSVACIFLTLTEACYMLVGFSTTNHSLMTGISIVILILVSVFPLMILAFNVTETTKKAKLTGRIVHKLLAEANNQEIKRQLEHFSLQLLHEDVRFTAHGFFELDFTLLQSILGVTATYLVIIIQLERAANDER